MVTQQFDVFKNTRNTGQFPFLLLVQHDLLSALPVRVVIPLAPQSAIAHRPISRLNPVFEIGGTTTVMLTQLLGAVPTLSLGKRVTNLSGRRTEIIGALDILISGI